MIELTAANERGRLKPDIEIDGFPPKANVRACDRFGNGPPGQPKQFSSPLGVPWRASACPRDDCRGRDQPGCLTLERKLLR